MPSEPIFPHLTSTGPAPLPHEVLRKYHEVFSARVADGTVRPFVFPYFYYGAALTFAYLCIPHTQSPVLYAARWPVAAAVWWFQLRVILGCSSGNVGIAAYTGVVGTIMLMISTAWLVWCRPQFDAKRVQRRRKIPAPRKSSVSDEGLLGKEEREHVPQTVEVRDADRQGYELVPSPGGEGLRQRRSVGGDAKNNAKKESVEPGATDVGGSSKPSTSDGDEEGYEYYWQAYPDNLRERLPWILDLFTNVRGVGWNWAIPTVPDLPDSIREQLGESLDQTPRKRTSNRSFATRGALVEYRLPQLVVCYFLLDAIKVLQMKDPYFIFGPTTYALPPLLRALNPLFLYAYRYILGNLSGIIVPLQICFAFTGIIAALLGPDILGTFGEPWRYPTAWGSLSAVLNRGLTGVWGDLWHQRLRFGFEAPSNYLIRNGYMEARSVTAKLAALLFAFGISGGIHAGISTTQFPHTHPWHPPAFFMLQALGVVLQTAFCARFRPAIKKIPKRARQAGNIVYVCAWSLATGPLFGDDLARGGIWLNEPIPISPLRGLGFGVEGDGWWCWGNHYFQMNWYWGKHWWESGFAL